MPPSLLFGLDSEGRVHSLSTTGSAWREMQYVGLDMKRISAVPHFLWAVGSDRQIYVHVHGLDVPIRVKEESYENERWNPVGGFTASLLPTDRYHFSSMDGTVDRSIDKIRVPSMAWQWESDWRLDTTLDGQPLDHDGWSYAVDFPAQYHPRKQWKSCVRRRKWVRYRRYSAMNSWCAVAPLHKDPTQEPFIDVSIGGNRLPGANPGTLLVWAVTAHGRVMFRTGVSTTSPEGLRWTNIATPAGAEVNQISVGTTGLVWALLLNGRAIVRTGVTRDNLSGDAWVEVRPPHDRKLIQISVGVRAVWAISCEHRLWFRKAVDGERSGASEIAAMGDGWTEMVGNMDMISVAPNDQVWGIGVEDRCLYFRTGVTSTELTGRTWRILQAPSQLSRASSSASLLPSMSSRHSARHRSLTSLNRPQSTYDPTNLPIEWEETSRSAPTTTSLRLKQEEIRKASGDTNTAAPGSLKNYPSNSDTRVVASTDPKTASLPEAIKGEPFILTDKHFETSIKNSKAWSPTRSVGSVVGMEAHPEYDVWDGDVNIHEEDESLAVYWAECDAKWTWCTAGACFVDPAISLPNWFPDNSNSSVQAELAEPWRIALLEKLKARKDSLPVDCDRQYLLAVDSSAWVKRGEVRCLLPTSSPSSTTANSAIQSQYDECIIELEWVTGSTGTLTLLNPDGATTIMQIPVSDIVTVMCCSEPGNPRLAVHAHNPNGPLRLQFSSDADMEDWLANLTTVCCQLNNAHGRPSPSSIWATTNLGDVFMFDSSAISDAQKNKDMYTVELPVAATGSNTPYTTVLHAGFNPDSSLTITGCVAEDAKRLAFNLESCPIVKIRHKTETEVRDVALHLNPRFDDNVIVRNSMHDGKWSSFEERDGEMELRPGLDFMLRIVCEEEGLRIFIHGREYVFFKHRLPPSSIHQLHIWGSVKLYRILYKTTSMILNPQDMFWRQIGGHLKCVETSQDGVTWGVSYDNTVWVYTGGWGGAFLKGLETSNTGVNAISDTQNYYIYENQRWNPVTGYTSTGLPTDRHMWSDITGRIKRSKDHAKPLSSHWQWISDWLVDFHTPGGIDRDGWQYAVDFPSKYHATKAFTDMVRRRRWFRRCQLNTTGPWQELGNTKVVDISLQSVDSEDSSVTVWAVAAHGDALLRRGVTTACPTGNGWEHVACDQPLTSISCGPHNQVWAVGRNGSAYWRFGITQEKPEGEIWNAVEAPAGALLKQISVSYHSVWGVDTLGRISMRHEITPLFPEGSTWQTLSNPVIDDNTTGDAAFRQVSVSNNPKEVWAVTKSGYVCRRVGIAQDNPAGNGWVFGINGMWYHITVKSWNF